MMQPYISLVFSLNILCVWGRAQSGTGALGTGVAGSFGTCICTPFYKCFDEETSSSLITVDDRSSIPVSTVISTRQEFGPEFDPKACQDILEVCCYNLTPRPEVNPTSNMPTESQTPNPQTHSPNPQTHSPNPQTPVAPQIPGAVQPDQIIAEVPTTCTGDRPIPALGASCGVRNPCGVDFAMSGFKEGQAQYGEFPWMVAVLTTNHGFGADMGATNLYVGGGSLIHPQVVLTAAHKALKYNNQSLTARVGEWNFASTSEPTPHQDIPVMDVIIHPRYNSTLKIYNIALLVLERPARLGETVGTICLARNPMERFGALEDCIVSGWGKDVFGDAGRYQRILKSVTVNKVGNRQCQSAFQATNLGPDFELHRGFTCAGDRGRDACTGDGGSPLVCPHPTAPGQYVQVGVAAWGIGCGQRGLPGVYWATTPMMGWIDQQIAGLNFEARQG